MALCGWCHTDKPEVDFYRRTNGNRQSGCKLCRAERRARLYPTSGKVYHAQRYQARKDLIARLKDVPCIDCDRRFPPVCMDFHHRDPATKSFTVASCKSHTLSVLKAEIAKCDVICANCHRIRTHGGEGVMETVVTAGRTET